MGKEKYNPPYTVSEEAVNLIAEISSAIERYKGDSQKKNVGVNVGVKLSARERDLIELIRLDGHLLPLELPDCVYAKKKMKPVMIKCGIVSDWHKLVADLKEKYHRRRNLVQKLESLK